MVKGGSGVAYVLDDTTSHDTLAKMQIHICSRTQTHSCPILNIHLEDGLVGHRTPCDYTFREIFSHTSVLSSLPKSIYQKQSSSVISCLFDDEVLSFFTEGPWCELTT